MGAKRKKYTPAYRRDAAHLVIDTGRTIAEVAQEIGVGPPTEAGTPRPNDTYA
jgi:transposase